MIHQSQNIPYVLNVLVRFRGGILVPRVFTVRPATTVLSLRGHTVTAEALGLIVAYTPQGCTNYFKAGGDE